MKCSVYDYSNRRFDVYRTSASKEQLGLAFGSGTRVPQGYGSPIGEAPEAAALSLPEDAVFIGTSSYPQGVMCRPASNLAGLGDAGDLTVGVSLSTGLTVALTLAAVWVLGNTGPGKWVRSKVWK